MKGLDLLRKDLDRESIERAFAHISREGESMLERLQDLDKRLTNTNFLTNGGGAVAVLSFFGNHPESVALKVALMLFTLGVIATGVEMRAMLLYFAAVSQDNHQRLQAFMSNQIGLISYGQIHPSIGRLPKLLNHYAGVTSQLLFILGVVVGALGFVS